MFVQLSMWRLYICLDFTSLQVQVFQYLTFKCLYCKICRIPLRRSRFSKTRPVSPSGQDGLERPENGKKSVVYLSQFIFRRKSALVELTSAARINKVGTERGERRSAVSSPIQRRTGWLGSLHHKEEDGDDDDKDDDGDDGDVDGKDDDGKDDFLRKFYRALGS